VSAIVHICFRHSWTDEQLHQGARDFALEVKPQVPGLVWKIFTNDEASSQSCGIYLFESLDAARAYVAGERVQAMTSGTELSDVTVRVDEVMEAESILAGAPLEATAS
jgi:hypothetical protein